ncbi:MAG TPA: hypothetical protein VFQ86_08255 [Arachidicoccus soli]|nr:hypothetical protein [Arachidicoccus soli]
MLLPIFVKAQNTTDSTNNPLNSKWRRAGNLTDTTDFIGTLNQMPLIFRANNKERMRITNSGNIGIGVKHPNKKLVVKGATALKGKLFLPKLDSVNNTINKDILFINGLGSVKRGNAETLRSMVYERPSDGDEADCINTIYSMNPYWMNAPNKLYSLCPNVKVGIGTDAPTKTLDVNGDAKIRQRTWTSSLSVGTFATDIGLITGYYNGTFQNLYTLLDLGVHNINSGQYISLLHLAGDGTFTLSNGTAQMFKVNAADSTVYAREMILEDQGQWPDFVFQKSYELMPLSKLESYITKYQHLPGVATAKEVKENGINIASNAHNTLQKVEELTLYLLEENKKIKLQAATIAKQQAQIEALQKQVQAVITQLKAEK